MVLIVLTHIGSASKDATSKKRFRRLSEAVSRARSFGCRITLVIASTELILYICISMQKVRSYFSMLFLALLLFPMVEKAGHELGHLDADHCESKGLHYCAQEHHCEICDYVLSSSSEPSENSREFKLPARHLEKETIIFAAEPVSTFKFIISLRGPPAC